MSFTDHDVAEVRHVVQRILVPCVFVIGLLGNSVSIYVLTRRRMRCTTNIYLTALAITDIIYLTMALLLSLQHYHYVHLYCKIYWMCYGVVVWLCDACSYISIYIAVCFTIERFIAIRYPLKRQTFCTESLAKKVIAGVTLFCLLSTISTAFEHQHSIEYRMMDNLGQPCNQTVAKAYAIQQQQQHKKYLQQLQKQQEYHQQQQQEKFVEFLDETEGSGERNDQEFILTNDMNVLQKLSMLKRNGAAEEGGGDGGGSGLKRKRSLNGRKEDEMKTLTSRTLTNIPTHLPITLTLSTTTSSSSSSSVSPSLSLPSAAVAAATSATTAESVALVMEPEAITQHPPLESEALLMETTAEYEMHADDDNLARPPSAPTPLSPVATLLQQKDLNAWENDTDIQMVDEIFFNVTQFCENVTYYNHQPTALGDDDFYINVWYFVTLCVFVLIPLCVLVTFNCFLIMLVRRSNTIRGEMTNASSIRRPKRKSTSSSVSQENRVTITLIAVVLLFIICQLPWAVYLIVSCQIEIEIHLQSIFGNIFNFLAATNAAANFFLYCVLSDKYRKTIREMITGYRYKQQRNTLTTSLYTNGSRRSYRPASSSMVIK
ncbi:proctolin receptor [Cochliomyia hominivorax]